jgi:hypothetical protein
MGNAGHEHRGEPEPARQDLADVKSVGRRQHEVDEGHVRLVRDGRVDRFPPG